ncbi:hypothetical protein O3M35_007852 [Rhynocoris fuscipes]|uniref:Centromere protein M n=1 Tax=Rhynocoris fuscipes TaxID=488301 RepID=A0AAW1DI45_9HEMI
MSDIRPSVMIISSQQFCDRLKLCLLNVSEKLYNKDFRIKLAESASDILNSSVPHTQVDFVAVVVDTTLPRAIEKCKRDISLIMPFFVASRLCLINGSCNDCSIESAISLIEFADKFNIPYFNGQIMDKLSCRVTAERILKLASFASGYTTGLPEIIPTPNDLNLFL